MKSVLIRRFVSFCLVLACCIAACSDQSDDGGASSSQQAIVNGDVQPDAPGSGVVYIMSAGFGSSGISIQGGTGAIPFVGPLLSVRVVRLVRLIRLTRFLVLLRRDVLHFEVPIPTKALGYLGVAANYLPAPQERRVLGPLPLCASDALRGSGHSSRRLRLARMQHRIPSAVVVHAMLVSEHGADAQPALVRAAVSIEVAVLPQVVEATARL